jgi:plastocyanin
VTVEVSSTRSVFTPQSLDVPANVPYAILFANNDQLPHNVAIRGGPAGSKGETFSGPGQRTYVFPALVAGTYTFVCEVHPEMTGALHAL